MTAVWGIGTPAGCRNRAVTANQSANPPTIAASTVACAYPTHPPSPPHRRSKTNRTETPTSNPVARRRIRRNRARRPAGSAGAGGGAPPRLAGSATGDAATDPSTVVMALVYPNEGGRDARVVM